MKRTGFKSKAPERKPIAPPKPLGRRVREAVISTEVVATPKGVKAKPGKRAQTVEEREWMDSIVRYGCIACIIDGNPTRPTAVHHILRGGRRLGHLYTLPLCDPGHHQNGAALGIVSRHPFKARFEAIYGTEFELLSHLQEALL